MAAADEPWTQVATRIPKGGRRFTLALQIHARPRTGVRVLPQPAPVPSRRGYWAARDRFPAAHGGERHPECLREVFLREPGALTPCANHAGGVRRRDDLRWHGVHVASTARILVCPDIRVSSRTCLLLFYRLGSGRGFQRPHTLRAEAITFMRRGIGE